MNALSYLSGQLTPTGLVPPTNSPLREKEHSITTPTTIKSENDIQEQIPSKIITSNLDIQHTSGNITSRHTYNKNKDISQKNIEKESINEPKQILTDAPLMKRLINSQVIQFIWMLIIFLPTYLIIKPLLLLWFFVSLPLTLVEHGIKLRNRPIMKPNAVLSENKVLEPITEEDLASGDEFIFQRDTIKGTFIKSNSKQSSTPSSKLRYSTPNRHERSELLSDTTSTTSNVMFGSKKMGRFLFPKKLIPKSIKYSGHKKTLVIDLDETLIHSVSRGTTHVNSSQGHIIEVKFSISGISTLYFVHKRPYCDLFLTKVSEWYNIVIFTASMKEYADPVIDWLESSLSGPFSRRLYRNDCTLRDGVGYIKDLSILTKISHSSKLPSQEVGLNEIIIIDNSPVSYAMNVDNAIQVEGWINDQSDTDLLNLIPLLESLRYTTDVRNILSLKNGEKSFRSS
ncbi:similar to Saccharomyces cerevisiae YHR004C NEM1 Probable catalytic subunit of Nem1p-Spo7p phosphatase holoenzyme [Maudiozyma saulgeensis]|uniref:Similar to Saccharomyces cerevisiae YHR004C NEM1 Probable catalytic subunit of Nem1p-Spo7p phosphatase holoenzyme n=1 Tax=Maudiozyma saulgeensis TaxID=1789683 RepID=A0A1X7R815_9SACH|nr:similar to Saccharomyces cerevisiae YHR004C NEM1 Probable catalytic subunit of Nem1p-Spo7p phosphatase holoenzyme [Kazachstania saulgeensis]